MSWTKGTLFLVLEEAPHFSKGRKSSPSYIAALPASSVCAASRDAPTFGIAKTSRPDLFGLSLPKLPNRTDLQNQSSFEFCVKQI